jgi:hypothetical protein
MNRPFALFLLLFLLSNACTLPKMLVPDDLASNAQLLPVKGKQGWMIKQKLSFGDYVTDKVKRGWTSSYHAGFVLKFQGAKQKLFFASTAPNGKKTEVFCLNKVKEEELPLSDWFSIPLSMEDVFSGSIVTGGDAWDFVVYNPNNRNALQASSGLLRNGIREITITEVNKMEGKNSALSQFMIYGYVLRENGKPLAAVETINNGRVWLRNDLSDDQRHLLQNMAAALLLRADLNEAGSLDK